MLHFDSTPALLKNIQLSKPGNYFLIPALHVTLLPWSPFLPYKMYGGGLTVHVIPAIPRMSATPVTYLGKPYDKSSFLCLIRFPGDPNGVSFVIDMLILSTGTTLTKIEAKTHGAELCAPLLNPSQGPWRAYKAVNVSTVPPVLWRHCIRKTNG